MRLLDPKRREVTILVKPLTPEQRAAREEVERRQRRLQERGVKPPASGIFGHTKKAA